MSSRVASIFRWDTFALRVNLSSHDQRSQLVVINFSTCVYKLVHFFFFFFFIENIELHGSNEMCHSGTSLLTNYDPLCATEYFYIFEINIQDIQNIRGIDK